MRILCGLDRAYSGHVSLEVQEMGSSTTSSSGSSISMYPRAPAPATAGAGAGAGARRAVGWCPQDDAVFDYLTVAEHLELFHALLRAGAPAFAPTPSPASTDAPAPAAAAAAAPNDQGAIGAALARLGLTPHAHKAAVALSGGMRRRLTLALACAGEPHLLLLDEPTRYAEP